MGKTKSLNPADAFRKEQRKKELKKNKKEREQFRQIATVKKDTSHLQSEIDKITSQQPYNSLNQVQKNRVNELRKEIDRIKKAKEEWVKQHPESKKFVYKNEGKNQVAGGRDDDGKGGELPLFDKEGKLRDPKRSVYYDPVFNPYGVPPPGMPYLEKPLDPSELPEANEDPLPPGGEEELRGGTSKEGAAEDGENDDQETESEASSSSSIDLPNEPSPPPPLSTSSNSKGKGKETFDHDGSGSGGDIKTSKALPDDKDEDEEGQQPDDDDDDDDDIPLPSGPPPKRNNETFIGEDDDDGDIIMPDGPPPPKKSRLDSPNQNQPNNGLFDRPSVTLGRGAPGGGARHFGGPNSAPGPGPWDAYNPGFNGPPGPPPPGWGGPWQGPGPGPGLGRGRGRGAPGWGPPPPGFGMGMGGPLPHPPPPPPGFFPPNGNGPPPSHFQQRGAGGGPNPNLMAMGGPPGGGWNGAHPPPGRHLHPLPSRPQQQQDPLSDQPHQAYQAMRQGQARNNNGNLKPDGSENAAEDPSQQQQPPLPKISATATISAAPKLRDLKKEAAAFIPAAVQKKQAAAAAKAKAEAEAQKLRLAAVSESSSGPQRMMASEIKVNAAPSFDDFDTAGGDENDDEFGNGNPPHHHRSGEEEKSSRNEGTSSLMGALRQVGMVKAAAAPEPESEEPAAPKKGTGKEDYGKFLENMKDFL